MQKKMFLAAAALCALPFYAVASDRFAEMDKDSNGVVSWEEFQAAMPQMRRSAFDGIDTDKNGNLTREEWEAFKASHGMGGKGMSGKGMPPAGMMGGMGGAAEEPAGNKPNILPPKN